jgi:hypothetical protein
MKEPHEMLGNARREYQTALALAERWRKVVEALEAAIGGESTALPDGGKADVSRLSGPKAALAVLEEIGRPLHVMELIAQMQARGYRSNDPPGKIRQGLVGALHKKGGPFRKVRKATFGLVAWKH